MVSLPIDAFLPQLLSALQARRNLVLVAEPGAGKTTRVPPAIATLGLLSTANDAIVMLQPRRVAARASAERIADERGWKVGEEVGYQVRFERRIGPRTKVRVLTEAILSRQMLTDPELPGIGCVILDEFHERSIHSDLALALLREVQTGLRDDLRIIVMSATLDAGPIAEFLGGEAECTILKVPGRVFPVEVEYRPPRGARTEDAVANAALSALTKDDAGHILAFLPGSEEIRRTERALAEQTGAVPVMPLHGSLPFDLQRRAISPSSQQKIILATNIAETSLTIDGVRTVIDAGLSRQIQYNPARGLERLALGRISQASATQRAGRAGRTAPGRCIRLWTPLEQNELRPFDPPELHRTDLAPTLLLLLAWGVPNIETFGWFDPPAKETVTNALTLLEKLRATNAGKITPLGQRLSQLPLHPRLARLLLQGLDTGQLDEAATYAAILSERDFRLSDRSVRYADRGPTHISSSDLFLRAELLDHAQRRNFHPSLESDNIDVQSARTVLQTKEELLRRVKSVSGAVSSPKQSDLLVPAFPDRVCLRRGTDATTALMTGGTGVTLTPESAVRREELFLALDARDDDRTERRQATVSLAHAITLDDLRDTFPDAVKKVATCVYDPEKDKVVGRVQLRYEDLVLEEKDDAKVEDEAAAEALAAAISPTLADRIARDETANNLAARIALAAKLIPVKDAVWPAPPWTQYKDELVAAFRGKRRLDEFEPARFLGSLLHWPLDRQLDEEVPSNWTVPTGNRIRIDYTNSPPILAVRLQEMFGTTSTPSVARGKVPLLLHLLSPGYKPVQVTQDLVSFWNTTYFQVRKDLKVRYPKHAWPENPLEADPVAKGRPSRG